MMPLSEGSVPNADPTLRAESSLWNMSYGVQLMDLLCSTAPEHTIGLLRRAYVDIGALRVLCPDVASSVVAALLREAVRFRLRMPEPLVWIRKVKVVLPRSHDPCNIPSSFFLASPLVGCTVHAATTVCTFLG